MWHMKYGVSSRNPLGGKRRSGEMYETEAVNRLTRLMLRRIFADSEMIDRWGLTEVRSAEGLK